MSSNLLIKFLNEAGIHCETLELLDNQQIDRDILIDKERYNNVKKLIPELKQIFSSSYMTSLQSNAIDNQRWPLLNIVRQVLRFSNYRLQPKRISNGYTKDGKKKYRRIFLIEKLKATDAHENVPENAPENVPENAPENVPELN